jgi:hypothetical protein
VKYIHTSLDKYEYYLQSSERLIEFVEKEIILKWNVIKRPIDM